MDIKTGKMDWAVMPRELTAENGAKKLLIGEFIEKERISCPECRCSRQEEETEVCDLCGGTGGMVLDVAVSWSTIKEIYAKIVEYYGGNEIRR